MAFPLWRFLMASISCRTTPGLLHHVPHGFGFFGLVLVWIWSFPVLPSGLKRMVAGLVFVTGQKRTGLITGVKIVDCPTRWSLSYWTLDFYVNPTPRIALSVRPLPKKIASQIHAPYIHAESLICAAYTHASESRIEEHRYMHHTCMNQDHGSWINAS